MPKLWLAQLLCPRRHAICGLAYDSDQMPADDITARLQAVIGGGGLDPWCGLCGSRDLHVEHGKLFTDDWTVAETVLRDMERANLETRAFLQRNRN